MLFEFSVVVWSLVTLVMGLALVPYLIWLGFTAYKRRWRRLIYAISVPAGVYLYVTIFFVVSGFLNIRSYNRDIFSIQFDLGEAIYSYDSERAFNGDGYSIDVYELPDNVRARFESSPPELLKKYPKLTIDRRDWEAVAWQRCPLDPTKDKYVNFALAAYDPDRKPELSNTLDIIRRAVTRDTTYCAFNKKDHSEERIGNVDFFVVDLLERRIYIINQNT